MKYLAKAALTLGFAAGVYAQQVPVNMALSGSSANSTVDLGTGTPASEYTLVGNGILGSLTLRVVSASTASPQQPSTCSGANKIYALVTAGAGVFRSADGSLLTLNLTGGSDCIDLSTGHATCIRIFQVAGGTARFKDSSGSNLTLTMIVTPVLPTNPVFFSVTANFTGTVSRVAGEQQPQDITQ
jgi:hypothetical protein